MFFRGIIKITVFFVFLELLLRFGGYSYVLFQKLRDIPALATAARKSEYKILCMGDSMTANGGQDAYPKILERFLNDADTGTRFLVINRGIPARTTSLMASYLNQSIDEINPDLVTLMVGVEDFSFLSREASSLKERLKVFILQNIKIARLAKRLIDPLRPDLQKRLEADTKSLGIWGEEKNGQARSPVREAASLPGRVSEEHPSPEPLGFADPRNAQQRLDAILNPHSLTVSSINDIVEIVTSRGKKIIIMQYPLIEKGILEKIVKFDRNVIFVDNHDNFEKALEKLPKEAIFSDMITPLFGHCTKLGNTLIAERLKPVILSIAGSGPR